MKRFLIFCLPLLLISFLPLSSAQSMLEEGHQWNIRIGSGYSYFPSTYTQLMQIAGDTTINNLGYKKLFSSEDSLSSGWKLLSNFLREDGSGKVFIIRGNEPEELLYDFSLLAGDTISIGGYCHCELVVDSTDFLTLKNGETRTRLYLSMPIALGIQDIWITGIGSVTTDFLNPAYSILLPDGGSSDLLCFYRNGELLYPENPEFCYITSAPKIPLEERVVVYPNPTLDQVFIEDRFRGNSILELRWYDTSGRLLRRETSDNKITESSLAEYPQGVYLLEVIGNDGSTCIKRIVKQ